MLHSILDNKRNVRVMTYIYRCKQFERLVCHRPIGAVAERRPNLFGLGTAPNRWPALHRNCHPCLDDDVFVARLQRKMKVNLK